MDLLATPTGAALMAVALAATATLDLESLRMAAVATVALLLGATVVALHMAVDPLVVVIAWVALETVSERLTGKLKWPNSPSSRKTFTLSIPRSRP